MDVHQLGFKLEKVKSFLHVITMVPEGPAAPGKVLVIGDDSASFAGRRKMLALAKAARDRG